MTDIHQKTVAEENQYLIDTLTLIENNIKNEEEKIDERKAAIIFSRKDMWENTSHSSNDFAKLTEMNQHLSELNNQTANYINTLKHINQLKTMKASPYFGRFDFKEEGSDEIEKIYIGISNLINKQMHNIRVYDWRAPISSIFYQYELGEVLYNAPIGTVKGSVSLKRQYKIQNSNLKYFFDCNIKIDDEILQEVLSHNSSEKMKSIVETIQKEQDKAIRDEENELLIVQGTAGSGKTSIALHRIAYLLYQGLGSGLTSDNILVFSPNSIFGSYISSVLPELGEENVDQIVFDHLALDILGDTKKFQDRSYYLESLITMKEHKEKSLVIQATEFKGSRVFIEILDRLVTYCEKNIIAFEDIYYDGKVIETRQLLKNFFLNNKINIPIIKRLQRIEKMIFDKIHLLQKDRIIKIQKVVQRSEGRKLQIKSFSRLLSFKEFKILSSRVRKFTNVDYYELYILLFNNKSLFKKLADGLQMPINLDDIIERTKENMEKDYMPYEDRSPLIYLKLKLEGTSSFPNVKHVLIDEAQDYYAMEYEIIKMLLKYSKFTILGDINQGIEKDNNMSLYDNISEILCKKKTLKLNLNKSYRSSIEISNFNHRLLDESQNLNFFERHGDKPKITFYESPQLMAKAIGNEIEQYLNEGYETIAVICKSCFEARTLYNMMESNKRIKLIDNGDEKIEKGVMIIPSYMAKGLEFDAVLVYNVSKDNYYDELDKRLLYIACTRALHRLAIFYTGDKSAFI